MKYRQFLIIVFLIVLSACSSEHHPVEMEAKTNAVTKLAFITLKAQTLSGMIRLPGQFKPFEEVSLFAKVNGFVKQVLVDRGSRVHKGQVLAWLEAPEMESQVQTANSKYIAVQQAAIQSREKYSRLKAAAAEPGAVSQLDLDNALARMKADDAVMSSEKANLASVNSIKDYLRITAPFDGVISQRNISAGALVGPGKSNEPPMFILEQGTTLRLEVMIPEDQVSKVDLTKPVSFIVNAFQGKTFSGWISRSAQALGSSRSEAGEIDVANSDLQIKPGMYAEVRIPLRSTSLAFIVPSLAIVHSTERMYIVLNDGGKARFVDIQEGMHTGDSTEIFGKLEDGANVLLHANDEIREGDSLK